MARIICVANQKGGVGKTTTSINLAACLAGAGKQTLLIDLDPQCNSTSGLGSKPAHRHPLVADVPLSESLVRTNVERLELLPGSRSFQDIQSLAAGEPILAERVQRHVASTNGLYDYVLMDCPPSLGRLTRMALACSDEVLMPIQCEFFAMEGLTQMIEVIRDVMRLAPGRLSFAGILLTMYDHRLELTGEVDREVRDFFGDIVFETVIPRDVLVSEAASFGTPVIDHAPYSRGTRAYIELCRELIQNEFAE